MRRLMNLKTALSLLFLFTGNYLIAQSKTFNIGLDIGFGQSYHTLQAREDSDLTKNVIKHRNKFEQGIYPIQLGLKVAWLPSESWSFGSGLRWANRGYQIRNIQYTDLNGEIISDDNNLKFKSQWLDIPLDIRWKFWNLSNNWSLFVETGVYMSIRLSAKEYFNMHTAAGRQQNIQKNEYVKDLFFGAHASAGVQYQIHPKWSLDMLVDFQHGFTRMNELDPLNLGSNGLVNEYSRTLQLKAGVNYKL